MPGKRPPRRLKAMGAWRRWRGEAELPSPEPVDGRAILETLAALPISTWHYSWEPHTVRHLGPMAQDFKAAFDLGDDDRSINMLDTNGVVMVAIQALYRRVIELEAEVASLRAMPPPPPS